MARTERYPSPAQAIAVPDAGPLTARSARDARASVETAVLLAFCAIGAALRFATIGVQSFDYDESFTIAIVHGSLGHALHTIPITESTPPLYYILAWLWTRVFGLSEFGIRSLSALFGTALIPVAFYVARRLGSTLAGLIAAALVAVSPFLVWYSEEARAYALLALLSGLSFWAFVRALDDPRPKAMAIWALASGAAVLSHYFAGYLVLAEAVWLVVATRRRSAVVASAVVAAVGAALIPLVVSQIGNRTQWIEDMPLWGRIKEVAKKWVTGEIAPTASNWPLAAVALLFAIAIVLAARRITAHERRGVVISLGVGGAAVVIPFVLDVGGLHYLISKNVMPAMIVLVIGVALILAASRARNIGLVGAGIASAFSLAVAIDGAVNPALQRADYRSAARALGAPAGDQVIVTPNLGNAPMALYRPGAVSMPSAWMTREVVLVEPLPQADASSTRTPTPPAPAGFTFKGRIDTRTYSLICYASPVARPAAPAPLVALGGAGASSAQVWPAAPPVGRDAEINKLCA